MYSNRQFFGRQMTQAKCATCQQTILFHPTLIIISKPKKKRPRKSFLPSFSAQIHEKSIHHSSSIAWPLPNLQYHHGQTANSYRPLLRHLGATESLPGMGWVKNGGMGWESCKRAKLALKTEDGSISCDATQDVLMNKWSLRLGSWI